MCRNVEDPIYDHQRKRDYRKPQECSAARNTALIQDHAKRKECVYHKPRKHDPVHAPVAVTVVCPGRILCREGKHRLMKVVCQNGQGKKHCRYPQQPQRKRRSVLLRFSQRHGGKQRKHREHKHRNIVGVPNISGNVGQGFCRNEVVFPCSQQKPEHHYSRNADHIPANLRLYDPPVNQNAPCDNQENVNARTDKPQRLWIKAVVTEHTTGNGKCN